VTPDRFFALAGSISGLVAVAAGAFGAHALRTRLTADLLATFETGARYQMSHALALLPAACSSWARSSSPAASMRSRSADNGGLAP
jgi:uncharacterized membrane protein YgdD (TMEM256/DUF423 family)